jgi:hypothetical protein
VNMVGIFGGVGGVVGLGSGSTDGLIFGGAVVFLEDFFGKMDLWQGAQI